MPCGRYIQRRGAPAAASGPPDAVPPAVAEAEDYDMLLHADYDMLLHAPRQHRRFELPRAYPGPLPLSVFVRVYQESKQTKFKSWRA
jgi:hypothetical protein